MSNPTMSELAQLDSNIRDRLNGVQLFAELNDDELLYEKLKSLIFEKRQQGITYQQIASRMPYAVAYLMVLHGIFYYDEGNYWQALLDLDQNQRTSWGNAFRRVLEDKELPLFDEIAAKSLAIVTPVLLHGGIPRSCLADYFGSFLQRYLRMGQRRNLSVRNFREIWLEQELQQVAMPVKRFISEGGAFALSWIQQSVEMAHQVNTFRRRYPNKETLDERIIKSINMPEWVTQAYWEYVRRKRGGEQSEVIVSPVVHLYGDALRIDLLEQTLDLEHGDDIIWQIACRNETNIVRSFVEYRGRYVVTNNDVYADLNLEDLFGLTVTLLQGTRQVRQWTYDQLGFVFKVHQYGATLYNRWQTLPNTTVLIATAQGVQVDGVTISPQDDDSIIGLYPIDVMTVQQVMVGDVSYQIHENDDDLLPSLQRENVLNLLQPNGAMAVYSQLPDALIPLSRNTPSDEQQASWRIQIVDISDKNAPDIIYSKMPITNDRVKSAVRMDGKSIYISLQRLLPTQTPSAYRIELYGKRGRMSLSFVYVPNMQVVSPNRVQYPTIGRLAAPQTIVLRDVPAGWTAKNPKLIHDTDEYITPDGLNDSNRKDVVIEYDPIHETGELILMRGNGKKLTIDLIFPRLEVHVFERDGRLIARDTTLLKDINWYRETKPLVEVLVIPPTAPMITDLTIGASVYIDQGTEAQQLSVRFDSSRSWFRIDTDAAYDTIRHAAGANAQVAIHVYDGDRAPYSAPAITIQRMVSLSDANIQIAEMDLGYRTSFVWSAPSSPSNWRVVAWSLSKPWIAPVYFVVPNDTLRFQQIIPRTELVAGDTYLVGVMSIIKESDVPPLLPPDGQGLLTMRVPGVAKNVLPSEMVAQLFVDAAQNAQLLEEIASYVHQYDDRNITVQVLERMLLRVHQVLMQAQRTALLESYWDEFERTVRPGMAQLFTKYKLEGLIAMMRVLNNVKVLSTFSMQLFERIMLVTSRKLFDLLVKYEIRDELIESHVVSWLGSLSENRMAFLRQMGVDVVAGIDGVFVELTETDDHHWHGFPRHLVNEEWRHVFQAYRPIQYEDALIATGVSVVRTSQFYEVNNAKDELISNARDDVMPSVMIWILSEALKRQRNLHTANALGGWWYYRQMRVLELLNSYQVNRGGLREYIENGMFRN